MQRRTLLAVIVPVCFLHLSCSEELTLAPEKCPTYENQINIIRRYWYEASPPLDSTQLETLDPSDQPEYYWFNPSRTEQLEHLITSTLDLDPASSVKCASQVASLFLKAIDPDTLRDDQWFGVMTGFPGGLDLSNARYIEIWVNDYQVDPSERGGVLHIEFGNIDEDFYQPDLDRFDDEDQYPYTWTADEDIGFVGEKDSKDPYPGVLNESTWDPAKGVYRGINSRISNGWHDTEDLNRNGRLDRKNFYYSLELRLDDTAVVDVQRDYSKTDYPDYWNKKEINNDKAWRMYRLDLSNVSDYLVPESGTEPMLDAIQHMRIWISRVDKLRGSAGPLVEIARLRFVE